ncbi:MAG: STM3941 family protein [Pontibacterium sp.]
MLEERVIELSKVKCSLVALGAFVMLLAGVWMLTEDAESLERRGESPVEFFGTAILSIAFSSACGVFGARAAFNNSPGLVVNSKGIIDNSSALSAGLIPWEDIVRIGRSDAAIPRFIAIHVKEPHKYANNGNAMKRLVNRAHILMFGTPVFISVHTLKISYYDLHRVITQHYRNSLKKV